MTEISLICSCGEVRGVAKDVSAKSGTRLACCCGDCQAFAQFLGKESDILDEYGGTDIFQLPVAKLAIEHGSKELACVRLTNKGLHRWYTSCCNTPIGNTMGAGSPFLGLIHSFIESGVNRDSDLGESLGHIQLKGALKPVPKSMQGSSMILLRAVSKMLLWKLQGLNKPSVFFTDGGEPGAMPKVLSQ